METLNGGQDGHILYRYPIKIIQSDLIHPLHDKTSRDPGQKRYIHEKRYGKNGRGFSPDFFPIGYYSTNHSLKSNMLQELKPVIKEMTKGNHYPMK